MTARIAAAMLTVFLAGAQSPPPTAPEPAAQWLQRLHSATPAQRLDVAYDLTPLVGEARDGEAAQAERAARSADILIAELARGESDVRDYVAEALGELAATPDSGVQTRIVRALVAALGDGTDHEAVALTKFPDGIVVPALIDRLRERGQALPPLSVPRTDIYRVDATGQRQIDWIKAATNCGNFKSDPVSSEIAFVLAQIGAAAAPALDTLLDAYPSSNLYAVTYPLVKIGTPETALILRRHLSRAADAEFGHLLHALGNHPDKKATLALLKGVQRSETSQPRQGELQASILSVHSQLATPPPATPAPSATPALPQPPVASPAPQRTPTVAELDSARQALRSENGTAVTNALQDVIDWGPAARVLAREVERFVSPDSDRRLLSLAMIALVVSDQPSESAAVAALLRVAKNGRGAGSRIEAMEALSRFGRGPDEVGPAFKAVAWNYIGQSVRRVAQDIYFYGLETNGSIPCFAAAPGPRKLPSFAWPPPPYSTGDAVDRSFFKGDAASLNDVLARLQKALNAAGFRDNGLYQIPGGFALATRMQQTGPTWDPLASEHQWDVDQPPPSNLAEYVAQLVRRPPGRFRLVVFAVTDQDVTPDQNKTLSQDDAAILAAHGAKGDLPEALGKLSFRGRNCYALVYSYTKRYGQAQTIIPSTLDMQTHLTKARIWPRLANGR